MQLDRKGQTLILFVILLPLLLIFGAYIIDMGFLRLKNHNLREVTKMVMRESMDKLEDENIEQDIKELLVKNKVDVDNLEILVNEEALIVKNEISLESFFGKILGFSDYRVKINIKGYKKDGKIILE